jgi:Protein of unknown function (DUF4238)
MSMSRRHHYQAESIQKRFLDDAGTIFVFDSKIPKRGVFGTQPINVFVKHDLHTIKHGNGTKSVALEEWFAVLEGDVAPVIDKIIVAARSRRCPLLTQTERGVWDMFTCYQYKRAPDVYERLGVLTDFESSVNLRIQEIEHRIKRKLTPTELAPVKQPGAIDRIKHNAIVDARGKIPPRFLSAISARGIAVGLIVAPDKSFIIGDHPHVRTKGYDLNDHRQEFWLPISSDVAVSPGGVAGTEAFVPIDGGQVRIFNKWIARNSNVIGARSQVLVQNLSSCVGSGVKAMH